MTPIVSICCITYNHEKYIKETLKSLVNQKTTFEYEIIVHDDASTDNTRNIIEEFRKKYPDLIKTIYQDTNQYSQKIRILYEHVIPNVNTNYLAFCEGDDYWVDKNKLQIQFDFLEQNLEYSSCFHGVVKVNISGESNGGFLGPVNRGDKDYTLSDVAMGGVLHLSSLFLRNSVIKDEIPQWATKTANSDYTLAVISSATGKIRFFDRIMSAYRVGVEGSAMTKDREEYSKSNIIRKFKERNEILEEANRYYKFKHNIEFTKIINNYELRINILEKKYKFLLDRKIFSYTKNYKISYILKVGMVTLFPNIIESILRKYHSLKIAFNKKL